LIKAPRLKGKARVVYLYKRYKRVSAIAASIAGITALTISALVWSISPAKTARQSDVILLKKDFEQKIAQVHKENRALNAKIDNVKDQTSVDSGIRYVSGGTGFLIDTKGYLVTNAHVVKDAEHVAVQSSSGKDLRAKVIYSDLDKDIAILKITDKNFKPSSFIPYSIKRSSGELAESIFTLGYSRKDNDIVYGDGYIASKTGIDGDTLSCQITIAANKGNTGSPILNKNGEVIGILTKKENTVEGAVFALRSKYIIEALNALQKDSSYKNIKLPTSSALKGKDRTQQVKTIGDYVFMVKVD
jgi:S1-C subfamily serine protease